MNLAGITARQIFIIYILFKIKYTSYFCLIYEKY